LLLCVLCVLVGWVVVGGWWVLGLVLSVIGA